MPNPKQTVEQLSSHAAKLIAGLQSIPIEELVQCARENLRATRKVRMGKDDPQGTEEPDFSTRQKALEFITNQCAGAAASRKPIEPPKVDASDADKGALRPVKAS